MKQKALFLLPLLFFACTTPENDPSVRYTSEFLHTRIDFQPLKRPDLENQVKLEEQLYTGKRAKLDEHLAGLAAQRKEALEKIQDQIPDCRHQANCLSGLARGDVKKFEQYRELVAPLNALDFEAGQVQNDQKLLDKRLDLRTRALFNRYLVSEILQVKKESPQIRDILVHSLEAYPTRRAISDRLARLSDPDVVPTLYGDLNFQMLGQPVDEAAVIATLDLRIEPDKSHPGQLQRYLVTFLVNTHQKDVLAYSKGFLRTWAKRLEEPDQKQLREEVFCGLYSIAGETLVDKLSEGKVKPCTPVRLEQQEKTAKAVPTRMDPDNWILPIALALPGGS